MYVQPINANSIMKNQVVIVDYAIIILGGKIPVWDILWDYKGIYDNDIGERIIPEEYGYGLRLDEEMYIISEDFQGNYKKTAELLSSRGTDKTMVHVIVPGYLLRDYILARPENILLQEGVTKKDIVSEI